MKSKFCGIVILNYNTPNDTIKCIESILYHNSADIKIVVVDNASTDDSVERICNYFPGMKIVGCDENESVDLQKLNFIVSDTNVGYACGNNLGIKLLNQDESIDSILILNSDILFVEDIIPKMLEDLKEEDVAIVSPVLFKKNMVEYDYNCARKIPPYYLILLRFLMSGHEPKFLKDRLFLLKRQTMESGLMKVGLPSGSCMLFYKTVCEKIKIFDPNTFLYYEENIIASELAKHHCGCIYVDLNLRCIHLGATSTKKTPSRKIVECEVQSAKYYVNKSLNKKSFLFDLACKWYLLLDSLKRRIGNR